MRAVLIICVIIVAAVACPLKDDCSCNLPKIYPATWDIKEFKSTYATIAFQGPWILQCVTPAYMHKQNPLKTGILCNTFPCTKNKLIFEDTTPCDKDDFNTEYKLIHQSYNLYTQTIETQEALLCPAYKDSPFAIFNVGSQNNYKDILTEKYPFVDDKLFRHEIGQGICEIEYTMAVIGCDEDWEEYMVFIIMNQYENYFCGDDYIILLLTRKETADWSTYEKAYNDIKNSGLNPSLLVSVDQSIDLTSIPSLTVPSITPTISGDIDDVTEKTSISTNSVTKSVVSESSSSSLTSSSSSITSSSTTTSTVVIQQSTDFSSLYEVEPCDLYKDIQILKGLDDTIIPKALGGKYFLYQATPCSVYNNPDSKAGFLNTVFPKCSIEVYFEEISTDKWDHNTHYMMMERGYDMRTGRVDYTRSFISSVYPEGHPHCGSVYAIYSEGYCDENIEETNPLTIDGMICEQPSEIYKYRIIATILGYEENEFLLISIANQYKNLFFGSEQNHEVYALTRNRFPSLNTLKSINQQLLLCGFNPNFMVKIDQSICIDGDYVFDRSCFESQTSSVTTSGISSISSTTITSESSSSSISVSC